MLKKAGMHKTADSSGQGRKQGKGDLGSSKKKKKMKKKKKRE